MRTWFTNVWHAILGLLRQPKLTVTLKTKWTGYKKKTMPLDEIRFQRPVSPGIKVSAHYGKKGPWWSWIVNSEGRWVRGKLRGVGMHRGIDFAAPLDAPVYAACDGEIEFVGWENGIDRKKGFGKFIRQSVRINEENWHFYYGHLDSYKVKAAQRIKRGELIAYTGNTGRSTGHHLHIELRSPDWQSHPILFERDIKNA